MTDENNKDGAGEAATLMWKACFCQLQDQVGPRAGDNTLVRPYNSIEPNQSYASVV
jgi:hypothetical protein